MKGLIRTVIEGGQYGIIVDVECQLANSLPNIIIVGFASKAVEEARERIRAAFASSKLDLPRKRIILNLAPADIPKQGTASDLAMAVSIMVTAQACDADWLTNVPLFGELGLDGQVRSVRGIIGKVLAAQKLGFKEVIVPAGNLAQASLVPGVTFLPVSTLSDIWLCLNQAASLPKVQGGTHVINRPIQVSGRLDFSEVVGQQRAKRALEIAAAGSHNVLLSGPPGSGKSMLAKAMPSILPELNHQEILEVTHLHSLASKQYDKLITERPFRAPHHSASDRAIIGGGSNPHPGEVSLAHHGILFLDELPEFSRPSIEALRQPLEDHQITITRAQETVTFPAKFMLIATANDCPYGFYGSTKICSCSPAQIVAYQRKLSGPIIDRIDLCVQVDDVHHADLLQPNKHGDSSATIHQRITQARTIQAQRFMDALKTNAQLTNQDIKRHALLEPAAIELLNHAAHKLGLSARAYMRSIKVARTIADLEASKPITLPHIAEALQYRKQDTAM